MDFIAKNKKEMLKLIVVLLPLLGLGGLAINQQKELQELRTVVIHDTPVEVIVERDNHEHNFADKKHSHKHTHPELEKLKASINYWH